MASTIELNSLGVAAAAEDEWKETCMLPVGLLSRLNCRARNLQALHVLNVWTISLKFWTLLILWHFEHLRSSVSSEIVYLSDIIIIDNNPLSPFFILVCFLVLLSLCKPLTSEYIPYLRGSILSSWFLSSLYFAGIYYTVAPVSSPYSHTYTSLVLLLISLSLNIRWWLTARCANSEIPHDF